MQFCSTKIKHVIFSTFTKRILDSLHRTLTEDPFILHLWRCFRPRLTLCMFLVQIYLSLPYSLQLGNSLGRHSTHPWKAKSRVLRNCIKRMTLLNSFGNSWRDESHSRPWKCLKSSGFDSVRVLADGSWMVRDRCWVCNRVCESSIGSLCEHYMQKKVSPSKQVPLKVV
jgi:hypothetical protein